MTFIEDLVSQIQKWPVSVALVVSLSLFGIVLKKIKAFPSRFISLALILLATGLYILIGETGTIGPTIRYPDVVLGIYGSILGALAWICHGVIYKQIIQRLPGVKNGNNDTTTTFTKKDDK